MSEPERTDRRQVSKAIRAQLRVGAERRVYVLPKSLMNAVAAYQAKHMLPSEVAAVRVLLDRGLTLEGD